MKLVAELGYRVSPVREPYQPKVTKVTQAM